MRPIYFDPGKPPLTVELVAHTGSISLLQEVYSVYYDNDASEETISKAIDHMHMSGMEFVEFHFKISGISRACSHQLVRHRIAEYAQRSQRYVNESGFEFVTPPSIGNAPCTDYEKELGLPSEALSVYDAVMMVINSSYRELIELGIPQEDARYILPNACCTEIHVKMNYRQLWHFCQLRLCAKAQWEIRAVAEGMRALVVGISPFLGAHLVPQCEVLMWCPEQKGCGRKITRVDVQRTLDAVKSDDDLKSHVAAVIGG